MKLFDWADQRVKNRTIWDIGVLKIFCLIVGMILGATMVEFVLSNMTWFLVVGILFFIVLIFRFFMAKGK